jgi:prepilin-type N-terminal cleavage/methylation domain-containing protein
MGFHVKSGSRCGLTLIEVLIAIAILGAGLAVMMTGASRCLAVMKAARNFQTVQWTFGLALAEHPLFPTNRLEDIEVTPQDYNDMTFERTVDEKKDTKEDDGLYVVRTSVGWKDRGRTWREEMVQYIYLTEDQREKK